MKFQPCLQNITVGVCSVRTQTRPRAITIHFAEFRVLVLVRMYKLHTYGAYAVAELLPEQTCATTQKQHTHTYVLCFECVTTSASFFPYVLTQTHTCICQG